MFFVFFALWLLLNSHFAADTAFLEIVIFGLFVSGVAFFFMLKFTRWTWDFEKFFLKHILSFLLYALVLLWNIIVSNFKVIFTILNPKESPDPIIVSINVPLRNEMLRSILANSITITPGTITISETDSHFLVHCLKREYIEGFENSLLCRILLRMEASK